MDGSVTEPQIAPCVLAFPGISPGVFVLFLVTCSESVNLWGVIGSC